MLLRLAYLGVTNVFALLRLLPASDRDKVIEILALRHQIAVLELCVPRISSMALASKVAYLLSRRDDHRSCACGSCSS
ncbi:MAG TPA: hypothetical protein VGL63_13735 [Streptosporangiaceae bacterium]